MDHLMRMQLAFNRARQRETGRDPPGEALPARMSRATVYFEADLHQASRLKAAASDRSISDLVNEAVSGALAEGAENLAAFDRCRAERSVSFASFVHGLMQRGWI